MASIVVDNMFGGVVLVIAATVMLHLWMATQVGAVRRKYKIAPPTMYVSEAENPGAKVYNCVQRAHQNSLEQLNLFFPSLVAAGIMHSIAATVLGAVFVLGRYLYFTGYATGDPNRRFRGMFSMMAVGVLILLSISSGVQLLLK
jgi:glutathione S-transferase